MDNQEFLHVMHAQDSTVHDAIKDCARRAARRGRMSTYDPRTEARLRQICEELRKANPTSGADSPPHA